MLGPNRTSSRFGFPTPSRSLFWIAETLGCLVEACGTAQFAWDLRRGQCNAVGVSASSATSCVQMAWQLTGLASAKSIPNAWAVHAWASFCGGRSRLLAGVADGPCRDAHAVLLVRVVVPRCTTEHAIFRHPRCRLDEDKHGRAVTTRVPGTTRSERRVGGCRKTQRQKKKEGYPA